MKIKSLHLEHRHRRLITAIKNERMKIFYKLYISSLLILILIAWMIYSNSLSNTVLLSALNPIFAINLLILIVYAVYLRKIAKEISSELIRFWTILLFKGSWVIYFIESAILNNLTEPEKVSSYLNKYFYTSDTKRILPETFRITNLFTSFTFVSKTCRHLFKVYPKYRDYELTNFIAESYLEAFYRSITLIIISVISVTFYFTFLINYLQIAYFLINPLGLILFLIIYNSVVIRPEVIKLVNSETLKAIFCALYLRDPEHEITDQRVLGIPSYIDYKSLVQQVDSYMIDSKPSSGAEKI